MLRRMAAIKNQRHELFASLIFKSPKTGMSNRDCYHAAGYRTTDDSADASCARLLASARIQERISELRAPVVRKSRVTVESLLAELDATVSAARDAKQFSAVNGALSLIDKIT